MKLFNIIAAFVGRVWDAINHVVALPGVFIETCSALTLAVREQTSTIKEVEEAARVRHDALCADSATRHQTLLASIAAVAQSTKYLEASQRRELQRAGHPHEF